MSGLALPTGVAEVSRLTAGGPRSRTDLVTVQSVTDLQATVASAADQSGSHSTAPALLLQAISALGRLSEATTEATEGGRRPFRIPHDWQPHLAELAHVVYLLADQTAVDLDASVRALAERARAEAVAERTRAANQRGDESWF